MSSSPSTDLAAVARTRDNMAAEAARAGLTYVEDTGDGYSRRANGDEFLYLKTDGEPLKAKHIIARIEELVIPPNWHDVWICRDPRGHIQATGRDDAGRKQYIYHEKWTERRALSRCANLLEFGDRLGEFRTAVDRDLRKHSLERARVCALACAILERTYLRIGQEYYDRENGTRGLTTLRKSDVTVGSERIEFNFVGKGGIERVLVLNDRRIAAQLRRVAELPGDRLLQFERDEEVVPLGSHHVNEYIHTHIGAAFSAKDFRTWGGTVRCLEVLLDAPPPEDESTCHKRLVAAVKSTAEVLGNTPAVSRGHYIHLDLLRLGEDPTAWEVVQKAVGSVSEGGSLTESERRLVAVLRALRD